MSNTDTETEPLEVNIIEITSKEKGNNNCYFISSECTLRTKVNFLQLQYRHYAKGKKMKYAIKNEVFDWITDNGGWELMNFKRVGTYTLKSHKDIDNKLQQHIMNAVIIQDKECGNKIEKVTKAEQFKKYYESHKTDHIANVKKRYKEKRDLILAQKKKKRDTKPKEHKHCDICDKKVLATNFKLHCKSFKHIRNVADHDNSSEASNYYSSDSDNSDSE